jgi:alpha-tubulin suppressor-like RCC1 family protein
MRTLLFLLCWIPLILSATIPVVAPVNPDVSVEFGGNAVLSVSTTESDLSYQWYKGATSDTSAPVAGAASSLMLSPPLAESASFWVRVVRSDGTVDSAAFEVPVAPMVSATLRASGNIWTTSVSTPAVIATNVIRTAAGDSHGVFLKSDLTLWTVGTNEEGQLGDGTTVTRTQPLQVATGVIQISAGSDHTLFLKADGSLYGMGSDRSGQLGQAAFPVRQFRSPVLIAGNVARIFGSPSRTFFIKTDGSLWGMGANPTAQINTSSIFNIYQPTPLHQNVVLATSGARHTLFLKSDGTLWAMGENKSGQLGDGTLQTRADGPVQVQSDVTKVIAGGGFTLLLKGDGTMMGMGNNSVGQLGIEGTPVILPTSIASEVAKLASGNSHALFIKNDRSLWGMGYNYAGQLGNGTTADSPVPVPIETGVLQADGGTNLTLFLDAKPLLLEQAAPIASVVDDGLQLHVNPTGPPPFSYQWFLGDSGDTSQPIPGATESSYTVPTPSTTLSHWVRITNDYGSAESAAVIAAEAETQPVITNTLSPQTVSYGENAIHIIEATGTGLFYQWYTGEAGDTSHPIAGATGPMLVTPPLFASTSVWVRVSNLSGPTDSPAVAVNVLEGTPGKLMASGINDWGQLGDGTSTLRSTPVEVASDVVNIALSNSHGLFTTVDGVFSVGRNVRGQLGDGTTTDRKSPFRVADGPARVAVGYSHSMFVKADGSLWGMGLNEDAQLGDGGGYYSTSTPTCTESGVAQVQCGDSSTVILRTDGTVWRTVVPSSYSETPEWKQIGSGVTTIHGGRDRYFLTLDGSLWGRGENIYGQIGNGTTTSFGNPVVIANDYVQMAAGDSFSLLRKQDGTLWTTGSNFFGQLGDGTKTNRSSPGQVATGVADIAAGNTHSLFIKSDRSLWAVGHNNSGQLGDTTRTDKLTPVKVADGISRVAAGSGYSWFIDARASWEQQPADTVVVVGNPASFSVSLSGPGPFIYQWYRGESGDTSHPIPDANSSELVISSAQSDGRYWIRVQNPGGTLDSQAASLTVAHPPVITSQPQTFATRIGSNVLYTVLAEGGALSYQWYRGTPEDLSNPIEGATSHILVVPITEGETYWVRVSNLADIADSQSAQAPPPTTVGMTVHAMGSNYHGVLGDGGTQRRLTPTPTLTGVVKIIPGARHCLFLKSDGSLWGSGENLHGQLGVGTTTSSPTLVHIADDVADAAAGNQHSFILKPDGTLWAFGRNHYGQLANQTTVNQTTPVMVASNVSRISAGKNFSLIVKKDGTLWGYGMNTGGQLGNGTSTNSVDPVLISSNVFDAAAGEDHSLFLKTDGSLWSTGTHYIGTAKTTTPVQVATNVVAISAGQRFSLFLKSDRSLWSVGYNHYGQLGQDSTAPLNYTPARVAENVASFACGEQHGIFARLDGPIWTMGYNFAAQLGNGTFTGHSNPQQIASDGASVAAGVSYSMFLLPDP